MIARDKKVILITGAAGFVGANLVRESLIRKFKVHILVKKETNLWRIADLRNKIKIHYNDLLNIKELKKNIRSANPNFIFHLATFGAYPAQTNVHQMIKTNILGTYNLLIASKDIEYELFINTASSSEYGFHKKPMREDSLLKPVSFYAWTKASATLLCQAFAGRFAKPIITLRLFSAYGPYEESSRLIPTAIRSALERSTLKLTRGQARRDFIFVEDVVNAYFAAINQKNIGSKIFNIGTGKQSSNLKVAKIIKKLSGRLKIEIGAYKPRYWDTNYWVADISMSKELLGWYPKYDLNEGLKKTYSWFLKNMSLYPR